MSATCAAYKKRRRMWCCCWVEVVKRRRLKENTETVRKLGLWYQVSAAVAKGSMLQHKRAKHATPKIGKTAHSRRLQPPGGDHSRKTTIRSSKMKSIYSLNCMDTHQPSSSHFSSKSSERFFCAQRCINKTKTQQFERFCSRPFSYPQPSFLADVSSSPSRKNVNVCNCV